MLMRKIHIFYWKLETVIYLIIRVIMFLFFLAEHQKIKRRQYYKTVVRNIL